MKLTRNQKALIGVVLGLVVTLVALSVMLGVGLMLNYNLQSTLEALDLGTAGNATRTTLYTNINAAFNLSTIVPIVAGASLIIGAIVTGFAIKSRMS